MTRKRRRFYLVALVLIGVGSATGLALNAFRDNVLFFYAPVDLEAMAAPPADRFRLGGMVADNSFERLEDGITVRFVVTDTAAQIPVRYAGILPDLFREGQGVVANGRLTGDGVFVADEVLAKHDENYMPPEVTEALERARASETLAPE